jgi:nucleotidyltransferase AbiEii toxin of type IV toxin-antitoxin system
MPKERLRDSLDDLEALSGAAAEALGIPDAAFVEKDFWVIELLRSLVRPLVVEPTGKEPASAEVLFKGGTSLSKAYGLIDRFSEDVDILVVCRGLGRQATDTRVLRPLCERARADLDLEDDAVEWLTYSAGRTRNALYRYPRRLTSPATRPEVKLEMGVRGGTLPGAVERTVRSYVAEFVSEAGIDADFEELADVTVNVIAPVRTLAEKLALLHHAGTVALAADGSLLSKSGRHFYDVHQLLTATDVMQTLEDLTTLEEIAADVDSNSERHGWSYTPRPEAGYGSSPVFNLTGPAREVAKAAYEDALRLVWGRRPSFDDCLAAVSAHSMLL